MNENMFRPDHILDDVTTIEHDSFIEESLNLVALWSSIHRGKFGLGATVFTVSRNNRQLKIPSYISEDAIIDFLPRFRWSNHYLVVVITDNKSTYHFIKTFTDFGIPEFEEADFSTTYTIKDDQDEIINASNEIFLKSRNFFLEDSIIESEKLLLRLINENPLYSRAYNALGQIRFVQKNYSEGLQLNLDALNINPMNFRALFNIGKCLYNNWQDELSLIYLFKALEVNPDFEVACELINRINKGDK